MGRTLALLSLTLFLASCGDEEPSDSGWWEQDAPDITGQYQFFIDGVSASSDCEEERPYVTDWMPGALNISGDGPLELTFTFSAGMAFSGGVDSTWSYWFGGNETYDGASVAVNATGLISTDADQRTISGTIQTEVDDDEFTTNNCLIDVVISGTRISG